MKRLPVLSLLAVAMLTSVGCAAGDSVESSVSDAETPETSVVTSPTSSAPAGTTSLPSTTTTTTPSLPISTTSTTWIDYSEWDRQAQREQMHTDCMTRYEIDYIATLQTQDTAKLQGIEGGWWDQAMEARYQEAIAGAALNYDDGLKRCMDVYLSME